MQAILRKQVNRGVIEVDLYNRIRKMNTVEELSQRQVAKRLGISRNTVRKYWDGGSLPQQSQERNRPATVITEEVQNKIRAYLDSDKEAPNRKQTHTAKRIFDRLVDEMDFEGSYTSVANAVRTFRGRTHEAYVPLEWDPGEAIQVDWGEAYFRLRGERTKCQLFCFRLCHSCMPFVVAFPTQQNEFFLEGHRLGFEFFGGVARRLIYDNLRTGVKKGWGRYVVEKQKALLLLEGHYAFESMFCRPGKGNDKSLVESLVGWSRRNILVPLPNVDSWKMLNMCIAERCRQYANHHIARHPGSVGEAFQTDRAHMLPLPKAPFDTAKTVTAKVRADCLIRFDNSHYSVHSRWVGETVTAKATLEELHVFHGGTCVAKHQRSYQAGSITYDLDHYIDLLAVRPRAVRQAQPIRRNVPANIQALRNQLPDTAAGDKEFISILRLFLEYGSEAVLNAVETCSVQRIYSYEAIRFELFQQLQETPKTESEPGLDAYGCAVDTPDLKLYDPVLHGGGR